MANYQYDESGVLASYFAVTFLALILIPLTFSSLPSPRLSEPKTNRCPCNECEAKAARVKRNQTGSLITTKGLVTVAGWGVLAYLVFKISTTELESSIYDPFAILGLRSGSSEKDIKRHYKKLSLKFHPDKVKLAINQTMEEVAAHFVNLTKAYKALTDEDTRQNLEKYGHPDGKQEFSMGLALPTWVVESKNNFWVLGFYGILFAGLLPMYVGRWWFTSRKYTKDGVLSATAQLFFKNIREETTTTELAVLVARAWDVEEGVKNTTPASGSALSQLEASIKAVAGDGYGKTEPTNIARLSVEGRRALALLYAHMLHIKIQDSALQAEQDKLLLATPTYLTSMLSMTLSRNWLAATINVMHLQTHLVQGTLPGSDPLLAFPSVGKEEAKVVEGGVAAYVKVLEEKSDPRAEQVKTVADKWGALQVVDLQFKVLGERIVTPGAIVQTIMKLRLTPPTAPIPEPTPEPTPEERKNQIREEDERLESFMNSKDEMDALRPGLSTPGYAHAPHWPANRKPGWWIFIGDQKLNRVIVPPIKITDVPYCNPAKAPNDYRTYKLQFQAPPQVGVYTFQLLFVSDTYVGDDVRMFLPLKVEDLSALNEDEEDVEDEISDPDEDTLAGQMAAMRGEKVKRSAIYDDDDESSTDDDQSDGTDSDSDSD